MMFTGSYFKHPDQLRTLHSAPAALCTMAALEKLSPLAQMYESEFQRAFKLYGDGKDDVKADEAFRICRRFLLEPYIGRWHRAGFHLLLGYSADCELCRPRLPASLTSSRLTRAFQLT
jgi:hypothetical protein